MPEGDRKVFHRPEMKAMFIDDLNRASRQQLLAPVYDVVQFTRPWGFSLCDIRVPIRFWHGDADNIVPLAHAERMAALVPDAELRVRPGEGHIGNLAAAEEILDVILALWPSETGASVRTGAGDGRGRASSDRRHVTPGSQTPRATDRVRLMRDPGDEAADA